MNQTILFVDATPEHARQLNENLLQTDVQACLSQAGATIRTRIDPDLNPDALAQVVGASSIIWVDHTRVQTSIAQHCPNLRHIVFMGTGARSYMDIEGLAEQGITVHLIRNYGDTAVAECAFALMWASARHLAHMDRLMRQGIWQRTQGVQLTGKTIGLIGFGGIAAEMARLCHGIGMQVLAWNRTPKTHPNVEFLPLDEVLARSDVVSLHLLLHAQTQGFMSAQRLRQIKPGALLINTARGALIDEPALVKLLESGHIGHAGLDVFVHEPMPKGHPLLSLNNVTLSAHSAFRVPEANARLIHLATNVTLQIINQKRQ